LGIRVHAIFSEDDERSDHVSKADQAHRLTGRGPAAYLDAAQIIRVALGLTATPFAATVF
jgi:acetyl/propionyl-CoA carboxylase alpha subunit